ncbi:MAG TPA: hypothetical protein VNU44_14530 [Bryobacteraceae bacterium]|nr:hypothetical protein [Bryobacteraceae bacterium]
MSKKKRSAAIVQERSQAETARSKISEGREALRWDTLDRELAVGQPHTDAEKREAEAMAALPHETHASSETQESLQQLREDNTAAVAGQRWPRQEELSEAHLDERTGRILHASTFVQMLWKCGIVCILTKCQTEGLRSLKGKAHEQERRAMYERTMAGLVINSSRAMPLPAPRYASWVQIPAMIEYSVMRFDEHGLPTREKFRGWRTVLLDLIRQGFLTERQANWVFGEPRGPAARRWQEILQSFRNGGLISS